MPVIFDSQFFSLLAKSNDTPEKTPWKEDGEDENLRALAKKFEEKYVSCAPLLAQCVFLSNAPDSLETAAPPKP